MCADPDAICSRCCQVHLVLVSSSVMGAMFGFAFGVLDMEDYHGFALQHRLFAEEMYFVTPSALLSAEWPVS